MPLFTIMIRADVPRIIEADEIGEPTDLEMAKRHFEVAKGYFDAQEYEKARQEFEKAYALKSEPELLFNIGQCYRLLGNLKETIKTFNQYLTRGGFYSREEVLVLIKELEKQLAEAERPESRYVGPPAPSPKGATPPAKSRPKVKPESPPSKTFQWLAYGSFGAAAAVLGASLGSHLKAAQKDKDYAERVDVLVDAGQIEGRPGNYRYVNEAAKQRYKGELNSLASDIKKYETIAFGSLIGGLILTGAGAGFLLLDGKERAKFSVEVGGSKEAQLRFQIDF